ncbi:hypothetical protein FE257_003368 [Aspergillus nanangensis]|uniref:Uncharacterized protein n=1 Tax=Aspergillus nanangensis TaxID=2582783 RepID=A0AAD4CBR5_ASPNN|nr:hypothetical protein FE257_003368 [Aspergillus nanangensis]
MKVFKNRDLESRIRDQHGPTSRTPLHGFREGTSVLAKECKSTSRRVAETALFQAEERAVKSTLTSWLGKSERWILGLSGSSLWAIPFGPFLSVVSIPIPVLLTGGWH